MSTSSRDLVLALERAAGEDDEAFDASLDRLLERARNEADPPPHLRANIEAQLRAGPSLPALLPPNLAPSVPRPSPARAWLGKLAILSTGVAIGFAWGRAPLAAFFDSGSPFTQTAPSTPAAPIPSTATPDPTVSSVPSLRLVLEHLRRAQLELRAHAPERALATLDSLDARVAGDVLAEERAVTRALALCDLGDTAAARALAGHLLERASAYTASLRASCVGNDAAPAREHELQRRTSNPSR